MQCANFVPSNDAMQMLDLRPFWWIYGRGEEIIDMYGNKLMKDLAPKKYYFGIYIGDEIDETRLDLFKIYANRWNKLTDPKIFSEYISEDGWKKAHADLSSIGKPVMINDHKCINTFPFGKKCPIVYDTEIEDIVLIPDYKFRYNNRVKGIFDNVVSIYGELDMYYQRRLKPLWIDLNTIPCKEFACYAPAKYCIVYGWQINKFPGDFTVNGVAKKNRKKYSDIGEYICIKIEKSGDIEERIIIVSNKWKYTEHVKFEAWMTDDDAINKVWRNRSYSGRPCVINDKRYIILYPFNTYNPILWDIEGRIAYLMPSKAYPGDEYFEMISKNMGGNLPMYRKAVN